jgi:hypothetical protein
MEDVDRRGRECITGLVDWIEWISRQKGRESIRELSKTGGIERGDERVDVSYVRQFASMKNRMWVAGLEGDWRGRGNRLDLEKGNRVEVELRIVEPPKWIGRLMRNEGRDTEDERVGRESVEHGISVEGEFAFASAIANFTRKAREEEYFHGERVRNVREQLGMRARVEGQGERRKYVAAVGASEMGRMMEEVERIGEQVLMMGPTVRIKGDWREDKLMRVMEELEKCEVEPDYILVFGPGNEMVVHGKTEGRGTGGEKKLIMEG